jgi:predicted alpha/beta hydrolase family esterase
MLIISVIAGLTYGYLDYAKHRSNLAATEALVQGVATAIVNHQAKSWSYQVSGSSKVAPIFDVNRDGILDAEPTLANAATDPDPFSSSIIASEYTGFIDIAQPTIPKRNVDSQEQVVDAWGHPLRIAYARQIYGANGFGIWSPGIDGIDDPFEGLRDDIRSWENVRE